MAKVPSEGDRGRGGHQRFLITFVRLLLCQRLLPEQLGAKCCVLHRQTCNISDRTVRMHACGDHLIIARHTEKTPRAWSLVDRESGTGSLHVRTCWDWSLEWSWGD